MRRIGGIAPSTSGSDDEKEVGNYIISIGGSSYPLGEPGGFFNRELPEKVRNLGTDISTTRTHQYFLTIFDIYTIVSYLTFKLDR